MTSLASRPEDIGMDEKHHNHTMQLAACDYVSTAAMDCKAPSVFLADNIMTVDLRYRELNNRALHRLGPVHGPSPHGPDPLKNPQVLGDLEYLIARFDEVCMI